MSMKRTLSSIVPKYSGIVTQCIAAPQTLLANEKSAQCQDWIRWGKELGRGVNGYVKRACCGNNCTEYVVKHIPYKGRSEQQFLQNVQQEINIHKMFADQGLAPKIVHAFYCDKMAYIVTEYVNMDVFKYAQYLAKNTELSAGEILTKLQKVEKETKKLVHEAHTHFLKHNDLNMGNVMLRFDDPDNPLGTYKLFLVDFGKSYVESNADKLIDGETDKEIEQSFDMVYKQIIPYIQYREYDINGRFIAPVINIDNEYQEILQQMMMSPSKLQRIEEQMFETSGRNPSAPSTPITPVKLASFDTPSSPEFSTPKKSRSVSPIKLSFDSIYDTPKK
jgi:hypothetical protein